MIDITIPRECVYRQFEGQPGPCPRCGGLLQSHTATYLVETRGSSNADSFFISGDMGCFCAQCPTVIINPEEVRAFLTHGMIHGTVGEEFVVAGIVDLDAIPKDKEHLPLGHKDNPLPLVAFTGVTKEKEEKGEKRTSRRSSRVSSGRRGAFEEQYEDVLQNIEFGIIQAYREDPELTDWDALSAVKALLREHQAESRGRERKKPSLTPQAQAVYDSVKPMCEWRLGQEAFFDEAGRPAGISPEPITVDEMIACLKRIRKSINYWSKRGGRQGYLTFVDQYIT